MLLSYTRFTPCKVWTSASPGRSAPKRVSRYCARIPPLLTLNTRRNPQTREEKGKIRQKQRMAVRVDSIANEETAVRPAVSPLSSVGTRKPTKPRRDHHITRSLWQSVTVLIPCLWVLGVLPAPAGQVVPAHLGALERPLTPAAPAGLHHPCHLSALGALEYQP